MTEQQPQNRKHKNQLSGIQIMFAAILAIGMMLAINFSTRINNNRLQQEIFSSVVEEIKILKESQAILIAERDYAQSDAFVEQWARSDGKMVRSGEVLVIPLAANTNIQPTPTPQIFEEIKTSPPKPEPWTLWWALLFDSPPPKF